MVFCASQLLNKTMRKYEVIEKEMYGLVFGVKQFRCFLQGKEVNAWTDHKPLLAIVRQLYTENARLARLKSALADFELKLSWVATDKNISDIWTRLMKDGRPMVAGGSVKKTDEDEDDVKDDIFDVDATLAVGEVDPKEGPPVHGPEYVMAVKAETVSNMHWAGRYSPEDEQLLDAFPEDNKRQAVTGWEVKVGRTKAGHFHFPSCDILFFAIFWESVKQLFVFRRIPSCMPSAYAYVYWKQSRP